METMLIITWIALVVFGIDLLFTYTRESDAQLPVVE